MTIDLRDPFQPASAVREALGLSPHPEGGHYRELWRDRPVAGGRGAGTSILFLLAAGERSHWHRVDAAEIWLWQGGRRCCSASPGPVGRSCGPGRAWPAARRFKPWCRRRPGRTRAASALGAWSAASSHRLSSSRASKWHPPGGRPLLPRRQPCRPPPDVSARGEVPGVSVRGVGGRLRTGRGRPRSADGRTSPIAAGCHTAPCPRSHCPPSA